MKRILVLVAILCLALSACTTVGDVLVYDVTPQKNEFNIVVNKEKLSKDTPLLVIFKVMQISTKGHYEWKTKHIPAAFKKVGIENCEIYDTSLDEAPMTAGKYVMRIDVTGWRVKEREVTATTKFWVATNVTINSPEGEEIVKIVGEASDIKKFSGLSIGKMVSNLLTDMLNRYYQ